jgi:hypothetical protein
MAPQAERLRHHFFLVRRRSAASSQLAIHFAFIDISKS